jgi:hypothetical protein
MPNADDLQKRLADLDAIETRLKREVDEARIEHDRAHQEFHEATSRANELGLHTVDGAPALHEASKRQSAANSAYDRAVSRFSDFILQGRVPED